MKTLAERLTWARNKRGLSRAALDALAELSCGHSAKLERARPGKRDLPSAETVGKLARALGIDVDWLINGGRKPKMS
jgi:transcriptional regulator with XRE-family HTH domain